MHPFTRLSSNSITVVCSHMLRCSFVSRTQLVPEFSASEPVFSINYSPFVLCSSSWSCSTSQWLRPYPITKSESELLSICSPCFYTIAQEYWRRILRLWDVRTFHCSPSFASKCTLVPQRIDTGKRKCSLALFCPLHRLRYPSNTTARSSRFHRAIPPRKGEISRRSRI
jgi:hypothetical protein